MFLKLMLIVVALLSIAFLGLGIQIFFSKKKAFPETRIGHNKEMRKRKIYCAKTQQKIIDKGLIKDQSIGCNACE